MSAQLAQALQRIADWSECDYEFRVSFGSNGERDYYRKLAREALAACEAAPQHAGRADAQPVDKLDAERYRFLQANRWHIVCNGFIGGHRAAGPDDLNPFVDAAMLAARAEKGGT